MDDAKTTRTPDPRTAPTWLTYLLLGLLIVVVVLFAAIVVRGYLRSGPATLLSRVFDAYHGATTYHAVGTVVVEGEVGGSHVEQRMPSSLSYEAPNRVASSQGEGTSATRTICDGATVYIELPAFGRVLRAPAPESLAGFRNLGPGMGNAASQTIAAGDKLPDVTAIIDGLLTPDDVVSVTGGVDRGDAWLASLEHPEGTRALTIELGAGLPVALWIDRADYTIRQMAVRLTGADLLAMDADAGPAADNEQARAMLEDASLGIIVRCDTVAINQPVPDGTFDYMPPADLRLVEADSPEQMSDALKRDYADDARGGVPPVRPSALIGRTLPDITARDLNGKAFDISRIKGRPFILDFWASWHPNASMKLEAFGKLRHALGEKAVPVVAVSVDPSAQRVKSFLKEVPVTFTVLWLDPASQPAQRLNHDYGLVRMPHTLYVGADLVVVDVVDGIEPQERMLERLKSMGVDTSAAR